jgi:hypothetical protein
MMSMTIMVVASSGSTDYRAPSGDDIAAHNPALRLSACPVGNAAAAQRWLAA